MLPFSEHTLAAELIINNELDQGPEFPPATIKSIIESAPQCITHTGRDKPYGYVDWWPLSLMFNTLEKPYGDSKVRWAMALAIDQQQLVDIGQIGAGQVTNVPYPFYPPLLKYIEGAQDIIDEYNVLEVDLQKSEDLMKEAGFTKDAEGFWVDAEGNRPNADIYASATFFADTAPLIAEQLRAAGFDAKHVDPPSVWTDVDIGTAILHMWGHGGSIADPFYTLNMYHIDKVTPTGESCGDNRPRWANQEFSDIVDEMNGTPMEDPKIMDQFRAAIEIWLRELPEVPLIQYFHRIAYNTTYWTNWPTEENPYINGAQRHLTFPLLLWNLEPTQ
jgi:peptide/nickel transport system substrate-binding protein